MFSLLYDDIDLLLAVIVLNQSGVLKLVKLEYVSWKYISGDCAPCLPWTLVTYFLIYMPEFCNSANHLVAKGTRLGLKKGNAAKMCINSGPKSTVLSMRVC